VKFLIDAHLPPTLCLLLQAAGHDAVHTSHLPAGNRTSDQAINTLSLADNLVVVTKDTDFYYSHLLQGRPPRLLLVRTGNMSARNLRSLFERHLPAIVTSLSEYTLVELDRVSVRIVS
jgi:predicted nuclease of predicted toxin-antitoxin system